MNVGEVWEPSAGSGFLLVVLGRELVRELDGAAVAMTRCLTLTSNHPSIRPGGTELWHPGNLKNARRVA